MNTPGFTADASLYKASGRYHPPAGWGGEAGAPVLPSIWNFLQLGCAPYCGCDKPNNPYLPGLLWCVDFDCQTRLKGTC